MIYTIKKGKHDAKPNRFGIYLSKNRVAFYVTFTDSCRYDLKDADQEDWNKLFGIGYLWHHHKDSARFGWKYNKQTDAIDIAAYCYVNGKRIEKFFTAVPIGVRVYLEIEIDYDKKKYYFNAALATIAINYDEHIESFTHNKKIGYPLGPYFGGNEKATHDMLIDMDKVN